MEGMTSRSDECQIWGIEVAGTVVGAVTTGIEEFPAQTRESAVTILKRHGLDAPVSEAWYPLAEYVAAIESIHDLVDDQALNALGQRISREVTFPEDTEDVATALDALDEVVGAQHRGGVASGYSFRQIGSEDGRVECQTPYPCAFDRGVVEGVAVAHAEGFVCVTEVGACEPEDTGRCTYDVSW